jgi:hypothetical protein
VAGAEKGLCLFGRNRSAAGAIAVHPAYTTDFFLCHVQRREAMPKDTTILSGKRNIDESFLRRGRAVRRLGVSLFSPQVLHESAFLDAWVLTCQNGRRESDYLKSLGVCGSHFQGSSVCNTLESIFITFFSWESCFQFYTLTECELNFYTVYYTWI